MCRTVSVPGDNAGRPAGASGDQPAVTAPTPGRLRPWRYPSNEHQARDAAWNEQPAAATIPGKTCGSGQMASECVRCLHPLEGRGLHRRFLLALLPGTRARCCQRGYWAEVRAHPHIRRTRHRGAPIGRLVGCADLEEAEVLVHNEIAVFLNPVHMYSRQEVLASGCASTMPVGVIGLDAGSGRGP